MVKKQTRTSYSSQNTIGEFFRMGFGLGLGFMVVQIIFSAIALTFFISGFVLLKREQAKEKKGEKASSGMKIFAYILMGLGAIFALFLIIPLLGELGGDILGE
jgi:hypothetical protein